MNQLINNLEKIFLARKEEMIRLSLSNKEIPENINFEFKTLHYALEVLRNQRECREANARLDRLLRNDI